MPVKSGAFTKREAEFVKAAVTLGGGGLSEAARRAGYSNPIQSASMLKQRPAIMETIREGLLAEFAKGAPLALETLRDLMQPSQPASARVAAAKYWLDKVMPDDARREAEGAAKQQYEMTPDELQRQLAATEAKRAALLAIAADQASPVIEVDQSEPGVFE